MTQLDRFLQELILKGIHLWPQAGKLRYAGPPGQLTPDLLDQLKAQRTAILQRLSQPTYGAASYGQRGLWVIHQQTPDSSAYHVSLAYRIHSALEVELLRDTIQLLVDRHATLRTRFIWQDDRLLQQIDGYQPAAVDVIDAAGCTEADIRAEALAFHERPFDLANGPLLRAAILRHSAQSYSLFLSVHHCVVDGWSIYQLLDELFALYTALAQGVTAPLPVLEHTYTDYIEWQQAHLAEEEAHLWRYWQTQLAGELPVLQLPTDSPRPPHQRLCGVSQPMHLSPTLTAQLKQIAQQQGCTLYMVLLAAYQILLHRYSGQDDLLVGLPMAGRSRPEFSEVVGYFVSPVVVRSNSGDNPTFVQFLAQVKRQVLGALDHQEYPFARLVERLNPMRDPSHAPIFQASFLLQKPHRAQELLLQAPQQTQWGLALKALPFALFAGQVDIELELMETTHGLLGYLKGNIDLFASATLARMAAHLQVLLENIVAMQLSDVNGLMARPDDSVLHLPLLTDAEYHQIVHEWNNTTVDFGPAPTIHARIEQQVARTPAAVAVVMAEDKPTSGQVDKGNDVLLSYAELNTRANQLAHHLIALGVQPDTLVAVMMDRSLAMVVSLLAVLKAGGGYVPIDPAYPPERTAYMLIDSAAPILLTQSHLTIDQPIRHVIAVDQIWPQLAAYPSDNPQIQVSPDHLAYVIYTSGSTGRPKGIQITQRNVTNFLAAMQQQPGLMPEDRLLALTTISFDIAVLELYLPLVVGASVVIPAGDDIMNPDALIRFIQQHQITIVQATPVTWSMLTAHQAWPTIPPIKALCGGEAFPLRLAQQLLAHGHRVWNLYGPTEATVWVSAAQLQTGLSRVTLAPPLANTTFYILDHDERVVPIGISGELYIGGIQLARGYLNRPDLTAERFIEHPRFGRLYKTGDLCRWLPDGNIEYLGRTDFQVKLRGFRIELGEIEQVLLAQKGVREAVLLAREDQLGDKRLVAYLVGETNPDRLRQQLAQHLPDYMIPAAFVLLDALPLTPNGKLDRRALPAPDYTKAQTTFVAPRTVLEQQLADLWAGVLGVAQVGVYDNFFALGGHSLMAVELKNRVQTILGRELRSTLLFDYPTLAALVTHLESSRDETPQASALPSLCKADHTQPLPLSLAQQRLWFNQTSNRTHSYTMVAAFQLNGQIDVATLAQSLSDLQARHAILRTLFPTHDGEPVQVIRAAHPIQLDPIARPGLSAVEQSAVMDQLIQQEVHHLYDLAEGPLWRVILVHFAADRHGLILAFNHILLDAGSLAQLQEELSQLYNGYRCGAPIQLQPLAFDYADYAQWQRRTLTPALLASQVQQWVARLSGDDPLFELHSTYPRPAKEGFHGATLLLQTDVIPIRQLQALQATTGATLFSTFLAAWTALLYRYGQGEELVVGSPFANRTHQELAGVVGHWGSMLLLPLQFKGSPTFLELVQQVNAATRMAMANDVPIDQLVPALPASRKRNNLPHQFLFSFTPGQMTNRLHLDGMTATALKRPSVMLRPDMALTVWEEPSKAGTSVAGAWAYKVELFDHAFVQGMIEDFYQLLAVVGREPTQRIDAVALPNRHKFTERVQI